MLSTLFKSGPFGNKIEMLIASPAVLQQIGAAVGVSVDLNTVTAFASKVRGFLQFGKTVTTDQLDVGSLELAAKAMGITLPAGVAKHVIERIPDYSEPGSSLTDFIIGGGLLQMIVDAAYPDRAQSATPEVGRCPNCDGLVFPEAMKTYKCPHCNSHNL